MKKTSYLSTFVSLSAALTCASEAVIVMNTAAVSDRIRESGPEGTANFYASGNDDAFGSYSIASFTFTLSDFGLSSITDIASVTLTLTVNDRSFSDGSSVELFFTPDSATELGGAFADLSFDSSVTNGLVPAQFTTAPVSLGVFSIPEFAGRTGGETDAIMIDFTGAAETALISSITNGTEFQIIAAAVDSADDVTYSGTGNTFDPGDPLLTIDAVPEPSVATFIALAGLGFIRRKR